MRRHMPLLALCCASFLWAAPALQEIVDGMQQEVYRAAQQLQSRDDVRPYYTSARVEFSSLTQLRAEQGALYSPSHLQLPTALVELRVGSPELDDSRFEGGANEAVPLSTQLPLDGSPMLLRRALWTLFDSAFKQASRNYSEKLSWLNSHPGARRNSSDYHLLPSHQQLDTLAPLEIDTLFWSKKIEQLSQLTAELPHLVEAPVVLQMVKNRSIFVDSRGGQMISDKRQFKLIAALLTQADDGAPLWDYSIQTVHSLEEIDWDRAAEELLSRAERLNQIRKLPPHEELYRGPVLFKSYAAAQFFQNTILSLLSNAEQELQLFDGAPPPILLSSIGRRLFPKGFALLDLPQLVEYQQKKTMGNYRFDHEGTAAKPITVIDDGMLNTLPSGRSVLPGVESNGHFRSGRPTLSMALLSCPDSRKTDNIDSALSRAVQDEGLDHGYAIARFEEPAASALFTSPLADDFRGRMLFSDPDIIRPPLPVAIDKVAPNGVNTPVRPLQFSSLGLSSFRYWEICDTQAHLQNIGANSSVVIPSLLHSFLSLHPVASQKREQPLFHHAP